MVNNDNTFDILGLKDKLKTISSKILNAQDVEVMVSLLR